jgi:predicted ATPase
LVVCELPSGTLTFVFTDIEGSTRLLHDLGEDSYASVLAEHHRRVRQAFETAAGVEVDNQGDGFLFVFRRASDAVTAARQAQEALADGPVRVRMGLHTGAPQLTAEGYVGLVVHKGARLGAVAHGGQVLLSRATRELVDVDVLDLGEHRLKDFAEPEWIYQLGQTRFPPLKTISNTNLPRPVSAFVGREREIVEVVSLVRAGARLVTLTGTGGAGKTRLAIASATELVSEYRNGVFWVALAALRDPSLLTATVAQTLGARDSLAAHIGERELLLLLDNFEQIVEAAPELTAVLQSCANLTLLVTSRELLRVEGEVEYQVPPLREPDAVELFYARSQLEPVDAVAPLCQRLDYLPLAIELAAARTPVLSPRQILDRLSERLDLLHGRRDTDARQQTLRATITWSYDLLAPTEQSLFARLSVFAGGFRLEAAEEVCDATLDGLESLVHKNLLRHTAERFWMLETIREFASEQLGESVEAEDTQRRHAWYFLAFFESQAEALREQRETPSGHRSLVRGEQDNARAALSWLEARGDSARTARLVGVLGPLWVASLAEGRRVLDRVLTDTEMPDDVRGRVFWSAWHVARLQGDWTSMNRFLEEGLWLSERLGDPRLRANVLFGLGMLAIWEREFERARSLLREVTRIAAEIGNRHLLLRASNVEAHVFLYEDDFEQAERLFKEVLRGAREAEAPDLVMRALQNLGLAVLEQGRLDEAASLFRENLSAWADPEAEVSADVVDGLAAIALAQGDAATAARLLGATEHWRRKSGHRSDPFESARAHRTAAAARRALGDNTYRSLAAEGARLELEEAGELALTVQAGA